MVFFNSTLSATEYLCKNSEHAVQYGSSNLRKMRKTKYRYRKKT